jgi:hypothetical protein
MNGHKLRYPFAMFWDTVEGSFRYHANLAAKARDCPVSIAKPEPKTYREYVEAEQYRNPNRRKEMFFGTGTNFKDFE